MLFFNWGFVSIAISYFWYIAAVQLDGYSSSKYSYWVLTASIGIVMIVMIVLIVL